MAPVDQGFDEDDLLRQVIGGPRFYIGLEDIESGTILSKKIDPAGGELVKGNTFLLAMFNGVVIDIG